MLYFVGMLRRDMGTEGEREISSRLSMISASLYIGLLVRDQEKEDEIDLRLVIGHLNFPLFVFKIFFRRLLCQAW
jgi:hypothetical protein